VRAGRNANPAQAAGPPHQLGRRARFLPAHGGR
jgi:hypothetical protein